MTAVSKSKEDEDGDILRQLGALPEIYNNMGALNFNLGNFKAADTYFSDAHAMLDPDDASLVSFLSRPSATLYNWKIGPCSCTFLKKSPLVDQNYISCVGL